MAVVIDEAVELVKTYSTDDSGRFVNGILSTIAAEVHRPESPHHGMAVPPLGRRICPVTKLAASDTR